MTDKKPAAKRSRPARAWIVSMNGKESLVMATTKKDALKQALPDFTLRAATQQDLFERISK